MPITKDDPLFPKLQPQPVGSTAPPVKTPDPITTTTNVPDPTQSVADATPSASTTAPATPLFPDSSTVDKTTSGAFEVPEIGKEETVQGQLESVLDKGGPLMEYAAGKGMQYANTRGLLNSDMAAESAQQAVFQTALPIAQQDASTFSQAARLAQQGDINSRLQLEQFGYNFNLNEQQNLHNLEQLALQGDINSRLALEQFGYDLDLLEKDHGYRLELMATELANTLEIDTNQITLQHQNTLDVIGEQSGVELQQGYLNAVERRTGMFSAEVSQIYATQGLTPEQQQNAIRLARNRYLDDLDFLAATYSSSPDWDPSWSVGPVDTPSTPYTPPAPYIPPPGAPPGGPPPPPDLTEGGLIP